jgi:hypothetical protein
VLSHLAKLTMLVCILSGCNQTTAMISKAKSAVAAGLSDPEAAQFRYIKLVEKRGWTVVCGEVNGKNLIGAYAGFRRFGWDPERDQVWLASDRVEVKSVPLGATASDRFLILNGQAAAQEQLDSWNTQCA